MDWNEWEERGEGRILIHFIHPPMEMVTSIGMVCGGVACFNIVAGKKICSVSVGSILDVNNIAFMQCLMVAVHPVASSRLAEEMSERKLD